MERNLSQQDYDLDLLQELQFTDKVWPARGDFGRKRLVVRGCAANGTSDVSVGELETV